MDTLLSLLFYGGLFFLMMRFGCGSHKKHKGGDPEHNNADKENESNDKHVDPVCGMTVDMDKGYGLMHQGKLYRFCHRTCLDKFEANPNEYLNSANGTLGIKDTNL